MQDEHGRFMPAEDICRICKEPFTMKQKVALLEAIMSKQKNDSYIQNGTSGKQVVYL